MKGGEDIDKESIYLDLSGLYGFGLSRFEMQRPPFEKGQDQKLRRWRIELRLVTITIAVAVFTSWDSSLMPITRQK
jgi:hypothetical protein